MSRRVRWMVLTALMIAWLRSPATADPTRPENAPHDRDGASGAPVAQTGDTPWIDLAPAKLLSEPGLPRHSRRKLAAVATLTGLYAGFTTWMYLAWYHNHELNKDKNCGTADAPMPCPSFKWGGDRWFEATTYAGGADKMGHAWATMGLARGGAELLRQGGGLGRLPSALISCGLSEALFFFVEVKDGAYYEFSFSDLTFDSIGAVMAFAFTVWPRLDDLFDFRVQYWPSPAYRDQLTNHGNINIAEDYTGQTYLLAFHLGAIRGLREARYGGWSKYVDVAVGFETRGYKPDPLPGTAMDFDHKQTLFLGLTLNAQGLFDRLFSDRPKNRKITHGLFEFFNLPYTTLGAGVHRNALMIDHDGA